MGTLSDETQRVIVAHVVLIGLTPFIPIPLVDDYVKARVQRRLVRRLAQAHEIELGPGDVAKLADDKSGTWGGRVLGLALLPAKAIFKKVFLVLGIKGVVDVASVAWHRAYLLEYALEQGYLARGADAVREAIDAVCAEVPTKPVEPALRAAFEGSRSALTWVATAFARALGKAGAEEAVGDRAATDRVVDQAIDDAGAAEGVEGVEARGVFDRVRRAFTAVPEAHKERLRAGLDRRLR